MGERSLASEYPLPGQGGDQDLGLRSEKRGVQEQTKLVGGRTDC